jgi:hypothetical protein
MDYATKKRVKREIAEFFEKALKGGKPELLTFSRIAQMDFFKLVKVGMEHNLSDAEILGVISSILTMVKYEASIGDVSSVTDGMREIKS